MLYLLSNLHFKCFFFIIIIGQVLFNLNKDDDNSFVASFNVVEQELFGVEEELLEQFLQNQLGEE